MNKTDVAILIRADHIRQHYAEGGDMRVAKQRHAAGHLIEIAPSERIWEKHHEHAPTEPA